MTEQPGRQSALDRPAPGGLFRSKSLDSILADAEKPEYQLSRALGPAQLTLLGIGAIIGAGIFATIGTAAAGDANRPGAGPAPTFSASPSCSTCSPSPSSRSSRSS